MLPFIDGDLLKKTINEKCPDSALTPEERARNMKGTVILYTHDLTASSTVQSCNREIGLLDIPLCHSNEERIHSKERIDLVFKPEVIRGTKIPYPGFPSLNVLPICETGLKPIGVNCFGSNSKYSTLVLNLQPLPELPGAKELAPKILGQTVFVNWPMMHEAKVVALSDGNCEIRASGHKIFSEMVAERWEEESLQLKHQYISGDCTPGSGGVDINDVKIRLKVIVLQGMKTYADGSTKKVYGKGEADIPLQMALWSSPAPDPRFLESGPKSIEKLFPKDANVVLTKGKHKGCTGTVIGISGTGENATIVAKVSIMPPEPPFGLAIVKTVKDTYVSADEAYKLLKIKPMVFGKITGSLYINPGRYDLGLNLKHKKELYVLGYTRLVGLPDKKKSAKSAWSQSDSLLVVGSKKSSISSNEKNGDIFWQYTPKAIRLVAAYREAFPELFVALNKASANERNYDARSMMGSKGVELLPKVLQWLKSIETATLPRVPTSSISMPKNAVLAIQRAAEVRNSALIQKKSIKEVNLKLPASALFRECSITPTHVMHSNIGPILGDRFVNLCANGLPFGARGSVVGIHSQSGCVEVVMDEEFIGGSTLQGTCSSFRGKLCVWSHLLKLTASDESSVGEYAPKIEKQLPAEFVSPAVKGVKGSNHLMAKKQDLHSVIDNSQTSKVDRNSSSPKKQGAWREAKGPSEKDTGFKGLHSLRKVRNGLGAWQKCVSESPEKTQKNASSAELKSLLGIAGEKKSEPVESLSASADLKKMLGVGLASSGHQVVNHAPEPVSAADMLATMIIGNQNQQPIQLQPQTQPFNFHYTKEGEQATSVSMNNHYSMPAVLTAGYTQQQPLPQVVQATVPRIKKTKDDSDSNVPENIVPATVLKK